MKDVEKHVRINANLTKQVENFEKLKEKRNLENANLLRVSQLED